MRSAALRFEHALGLVDGAERSVARSLRAVERSKALRAHVDGADARERFATRLERSDRKD